MVGDTVNVPISLMIWLGALVVSLLGSLFTFSGHLLIAIRTSLATLVMKMAVRDTEVEGRLTTLERHDTNNEDERRSLIKYLTREQ